MIDYEKAKKTPSQYFTSPRDVIENASLPKPAKIEILLRWRYHAIQLETAQDENMQSGEDSRLAEVMDALRRLGYKK